MRVPENVVGQDEQGRLWDLVWMLRCSIQSSRGDEMFFQLHVRNDNRDGTPPLIILKAVCGSADIDDPEPAITVMLSGED